MIGEGFWPAYHAVTGVDGGYSARRPIYQLLWCLEYAQNTSRHLADTARLCCELGLAEIDRFE
jgi:fructosamine-3-kinase